MNTTAKDNNTDFEVRSLDAMPVGVGFDNGQHVGLFGQSAHMGDILSKGGQIDGGGGWGGFGRLVHAVSDNRIGR